MVNLTATKVAEYRDEC